MEARAISIAVIVLAVLGCFSTPKDFTGMKNMRQIKSMNEVQEACGRVASTVLPVEDGRTFPMPVRVGEDNYIQFLFYSLTGPLGSETIQVPHYCMWLDPYTAEVKRFWPCTPQEIGIEPNVESVTPNSHQVELPFETLIKKRERLSDLSPRIWELFFENMTSGDHDMVADIREYHSLFWETTDPQEARFVAAASPAFLRWLDEIVGKDR